MGSLKHSLPSVFNWNVRAGWTTPERAGDGRGGRRGPGRQAGRQALTRGKAIRTEEK